MKRLEPQPSLTQQVYQAILDEICDGALAPGTHLVQEDLAAKLGVSRQPVQQAMVLLRSDGLVQELGRRGLHVAPLDLDMMRHHYGVRAALDGLAARLAAERAATSPAAAADIRRCGSRIVDAGLAATEAAAVKRLVRHDVEFHGFLYAASGNPLLAPTAEPHWRYLRRVMADVLRRAATGAEIWQQHQEILDAVVRGDAEGAAALATRHVELAAERLALAAEDCGPGGEEATRLLRGSASEHAAKAG